MSRKRLLPESLRVVIETCSHCSETYLRYRIPICRGGIGCLYFPMQIILSFVNISYFSPMKTKHKFVFAAATSHATSSTF